MFEKLSENALESLRILQAYCVSNHLPFDVQPTIDTFLTQENWFGSVLQEIQSA